MTKEAAKKKTITYICTGHWWFNKLQVSSRYKKGLIFANVVLHLEFIFLATKCGTTQWKSEPEFLLLLQILIHHSLMSVDRQKNNVTELKPARKSFFAALQEESWFNWYAKRHKNKNSPLLLCTWRNSLGSLLAHFYFRSALLVYQCFWQLKVSLFSGLFYKCKNVVLQV